jgi:hypothetical protein
MTTDYDVLFDYQRRFNDEIAKWGKETKNAYLMRLRALPFKDRVKAEGDILRGRVQLKFKKEFGDIVRVTWPFARHGIFQEHGVGKGRKKGSGEEKPMPWIAKTLDAQTPILADIMKDEAIKTLGLVIEIKVNGIFEIKL